MVAYLNGELPERSRRRMARFIDTCPGCYREYLRQRDLKDDLTREMRRVGQPAPAQLERIWAAVEADLYTPPRTRRATPVFRLRYGVAALMMVLTLMVPLLLADGQVATATATQPAPERVAVVVTIAPQVEATEAVQLQRTADLTVGANQDLEPQAVRTPPVGP
jgi:anti-sigma factor RsiW